MLSAWRAEGLGFDSWLRHYQKTFTLPGAWHKWIKQGLAGSHHAVSLWWIYVDLGQGLSVYWHYTTSICPELYRQPHIHMQAHASNHNTSAVTLNATLIPFHLTSPLNIVSHSGSLCKKCSIIHSLFISCYQFEL